jgi:hypothetical protein
VWYTRTLQWSLATTGGTREANPSQQCDTKRCGSSEEFATKSQDCSTAGAVGLALIWQVAYLRTRRLIPAR